LFSKYFKLAKKEGLVVVEMIECFPSNLKDLNSNSSTEKRKKEKEREREREREKERKKERSQGRCDTPLLK
jgi:hypothetical protein